MNVMVVVAILLIAVVSVCAQTQSPSAPKVNKGDAQKVVTIISGDKAKTQTYCEIMNLGEQMERAYEKRKFHPAQIRIVRQNHRLIESDVCNHALLRNNRSSSSVSI